MAYSAAASSGVRSRGASAALAGYGTQTTITPLPPRASVVMAPGQAGDPTTYGAIGPLDLGDVWVGKNGPLKNASIAALWHERERQLESGQTVRYSLDPERPSLQRWDATVSLALFF